MSKTQLIKKINAWAGILGENIIGPLFYRENLTGDTCLEMLKDTIDPLITQVIEISVDGPDELVISEEKVIFQHDGCPAHLKKSVRDYLNQNYPNHWISRRGTFLDWPPRSPDLAPNEFFSVGALKICKLEDAIKVY